jgi:hypothetical protein
MVSSVNSSLLNYLSMQGADSTATNAIAASKGKMPIKVGPAASTGVSQAALQRAAGTAQATSAAQALETSQKALGSDLRTAMEKAGVKLTSAVDFTVKSDGSVDVKGNDADKASMKAFLKADTSQPSFASRIANQAQDAMKLSTSVQQSAAISQAAKLAKTTGGVMSLYTSLMQQTPATAVVFSVSHTASSLSYPGSLTANA